MRQMMSKFTRLTSRGRHPSKFSSHSISICFPGWELKRTVSWRGLQKDFVALRDAMAWNGNSKLRPSPARQKWQKGPLSLPAIRQSGVQVETVSLEGRAGDDTPAKFQPTTTTSERAIGGTLDDDDKQRQQPDARARSACSFWHHFARDPETTLHGRDACACFHSTTRLARMGLRQHGRDNLLHWFGGAPPSSPTAHSPTVRQNGNTRPPVRRRWRGGAGEGCSASSRQPPCPPFSRRGPRNTVAPRHLFCDQVRSSQPTPNLVAWHPACGLPRERVERREQMTTLLHNGETTTTTTTLPPDGAGCSWEPGCRVVAVVGHDQRRSIGSPRTDAAGLFPSQTPSKPSIGLDTASCRGQAKHADQTPRGRRETQRGKAHQRPLLAMMIPSPPPHEHTTPPHNWMPTVPSPPLTESASPQGSAHPHPPRRLPHARYSHVSAALWERNRLTPNSCGPFPILHSQSRSYPRSSPSSPPHSWRAQVPARGSGWMACIFSFLCPLPPQPSPRSARTRLVAAVKPSSHPPPSPVSFAIRDTHGIPPVLSHPHWPIAACLQYQLPCSQRQAG